MQIHNLPLKSRTREMGRAIRTKMGEVMDVDVLESGVNWGKFLWARVQINVTKKLVRGKRNVIEGGEQRWITFKYKRLPNFCYRCGLLNHGVKECKEGNGSNINTEFNNLQYRAWLRGEAPRKNGGEFTRFGQEEGRSHKGVSMANRRDAKCHRNIGRTELGGWEMCPSQWRQSRRFVQIRMRQRQRVKIARC